MRSRYDLAQDSNTKSPLGTYYKDILTIPMLKFQYTESYVEHNLTSNDIERPDLMIYRLYNITEFDDLLIWLNNLGLIYDRDIGEEIKVPTLDNMEIFYYDNRE